MPEQNKKRTYIIGAAVLAVAIGGGIFCFSRSAGSESTEDAFVDAHIIPIASKVAGQIQAVHVDDNQPVKMDQPLVEIDARDYEAKVREQRAKVAAAESEARRAEADAGRYRKIFEH